MIDTNRLVPARAYIDGLEEILARVKEKGDPIPLYYAMLEQIRPEFIAICQAALDDSRSTAERWLKKYMLKDDNGQAEKVAAWLSDGKTYKSHGKPIDLHEVRNVLKLKVDELDKGSDLWQKIWELLTRSIVYLQTVNGAKLLESNSNSLTMNVNVVPIESKR